MKEKRTAFYTGSPLLLNNIPVLPASLSHNIGFRYRSPAPEVTNNLLVEDVFHEITANVVVMSIKRLLHIR